MVALSIAKPEGNGDAALWLGPLIRERLVELIAADIAQAVRDYIPGAVIVLDDAHNKPYAAFLLEAAREVWTELQNT